MNNAIGGSNCPRWCNKDHSQELLDDQQGIGFDGARFHVQRLARLVPASTENAGASTRRDVDVYRERITLGDGTPKGPDTIWIDTTDVSLTPDEAEKLAEILLAAAAELRRASTLRTV